jgi:hypothetical protein
VHNPSTSGNAEDLLVSVEAAVLAEVQALGWGVRPGLVAAAVAMARILDNPKAVSSQPPAARMLTTLLDKIRTASNAPRPVGAGA